MTDQIRVVIADDHALVRAGFRVLIETEPDMTVVGEAGDGAEAVLACRRSHPDVVLMDLRMPGVDGLEAARRIVADPDLVAVKVLILTTFDADDDVIAGLAAGASGFLLKNTDPDQLLHGIRVVAGGEELLSSGLTRRLLARAVHPDATAKGRIDSPFDRLTEREREVVALAARGLGNGEICQRLVISLPTAKTHISRALGKVGARDRAQLVAWAYRYGLVRPTDDD